MYFLSAQLNVDFQEMHNIQDMGIFRGKKNVFIHRRYAVGFPSYGWISRTRKGTRTAKLGGWHQALVYFDLWVSIASVLYSTVK